MIEVPNKNPYFLHNFEVEDSNEDVEDGSTNKGPSIRIQKYHPIENVI